MAAERPLYGLILAGGASTRMGTDKAALLYGGRPQLDRTYDLMAPLVDRAFISVRPDQRADPVRAAYPQILDGLMDAGPAAGLLAAHAAYPDVAWLVLACDLPMLDQQTLRALIAARDARYSAIACRSPHDDLPEPFCAIWEPIALERLHHQVGQGRFAPRQALHPHETQSISARTPDALANVNTAAEHAALRRRIDPG